MAGYSYSCFFQVRILSSYKQILF